MWDDGGKSELQEHSFLFAHPGYSQWLLDEGHTTDGMNSDVGELYYPNREQARVVTYSITGKPRRCLSSDRNTSTTDGE